MAILEQLSKEDSRAYQLKQPLRRPTKKVSLDKPSTRNIQFVQIKPRNDRESEGSVRSLTQIKLEDVVKLRKKLSDKKLKTGKLSLKKIKTEKNLK
jgi:hypothetical protein